MNINILGWHDLLGVSITLLVVYSLAYLQYKNYPNKVVKQYLFPALHLKILASFAHFFYHRYVYQGGDTFVYYSAIMQWQQAFNHDSLLSFYSLFQVQDADFTKVSELINHRFYYTINEGSVVRFGVLPALIFFGSFLSIGLWFSLFAFFGLWQLFKVFYDLFPHHHRYAAIATLFMPSLVFWASSISKDALALGSLGFLVYAVHGIFIKRKNILANTLLLFFAAYLLSNVKSYILVAYAPAALIWVFLTYRSFIQNQFIRFAITPLVAALLVFSVATLIYQMSNIDAFKKFTTEETFNTIAVSYEYLSNQQSAGSAYDIGTIDPSLQGMLRVFPQAINVTLFRPYLWEANNAAALLAALESFVALLLTIVVFWRLGIFNTFRIVFNSPFLLACLLFSIVFGASVGMTSGNFGTLMRYKAPMMPFFFFLLTYLYSFSQQKDY